MTNTISLQIKVYFHNPLSSAKITLLTLFFFNNYVLKSCAYYWIATLSCILPLMNMSCRVLVQWMVHLMPCLRFPLVQTVICMFHFIRASQITKISVSKQVYCQNLHMIRSGEWKTVHEHKTKMAHKITGSRYKILMFFFRNIYFYTVIYCIYH